MISSRPPNSRIRLNSWLFLAVIQSCRAFHVISVSQFAMNGIEWINFYVNERTSMKQSKNWSLSLFLDVADYDVSFVWNVATFWFHSLNFSLNHFLMLELPTLFFCCKRCYWHGNIAIFCRHGVNPIEIFYKKVGASMTTPRTNILNLDKKIAIRRNKATTKSCCAINSNEFFLSVRTLSPMNFQFSSNAPTRFSWALANETFPFGYNYSARKTAEFGSVHDI